MRPTLGCPCRVFAQIQQPLGRIARPRLSMSGAWARQRSLSHDLALAHCSQRNEPEQMPLNIGASGAAKPYVKYNSKADKWFTRGDGGDVEIDRPTFVADLANIRTGWMCFREGQAPEKVIDPSLDRTAPSPGDGFKRGFVMMVYSSKSFGGAVELASASLHMGNAIRELYQAVRGAAGDHPGQLPVIACVGSEAMKDRYGTNYKPRLELVKWVDRPAELPDESPVDVADVWQGAPASTARPPYPCRHPQQDPSRRPPIHARRGVLASPRREAAVSSPPVRHASRHDARRQCRADDPSRSRADGASRRTLVRRRSRRVP